jgi:hypothetical protein
VANRSLELDHPGVGDFPVNGAVNVEALPPAGLLDCDAGQLEAGDLLPREALAGHD